MALEDWHTHNEMCHHAVGSIEDYLRQAIKGSLQTIGISDHFPYEFLKNIERIPYKEYAITLPEIEDYLSTAEKLKEKFKTNINVRVGFEVDYFKNQALA
ncbi:MAG: PHP domain-containing protein, partial [Candidatus Lokiarchaeota archaeon]|nr:PHP domain-containing protein [Candidatus Lokiarchaeota archaeon]